MIRTAFTAAVAMGVLAAPAAYAGDELTIGDPAPKLEITHWLKGEPIENFQDDNIYVVEFWATWCGPCIASMPHISKLQEKYKDYDVTFIGVSDEPLPKVVNFLFEKNKQDGKINQERTLYTLTTDPDKSVYNDYMVAAAQNGIPTAFIVGKDQAIEWIGHPMGIDDPLDAVVRDTWDRDKFKVTFEKQIAEQRAMMKVRAALMEAMGENDFEKALEVIDAALEETPGNASLQQQKFMILLVQMDQPEKAYAVAAEVIEQNWDEAMMLNQIAWFIVDDPQVKTRNLEIAMKAAKRASELTDNKNAAILDTVARVYYESGDLESAVKWQRKAVKYAEGTDMASDLKAALEKYENEND